MLKRPTVLLALIAQGPLAFAQEAAPTARAQRDAENPLRVILEAGKLKPRKGGEAERPVAKPERVQLRARAAGEPASAPVASRSANAVPMVAPVPVSGPDAQAVIAGRRPAPTLPEIELPPAAPREAPAAELSLPLPLPPLRVAQMVEPVLPRRVSERLRGEVEVVVAFTVQPDGSVRDPAIQSSTHPVVNATVLQAVAQWRYAPLAAAREHTVQVLLRNEP